MVEKPSLSEMTKLFSVVDRELQDANAVGLSVDGKFMHAYDAALVLCMIALRACGYRVTKGAGHHKHSIGSLRFTLGECMQPLADEIEIASRKRGQAMYDRTGVVQTLDADELLESARKLRREVLDWMAAAHPRLVPTGLVNRDS